MQPVRRQRLVDEVERVLLTETTKQIVIEHQLLVLVQRAAAAPHLRRPESRRLRQIVALPDLQYTPMTLEGTRMLDADKAIMLVDETAAAHHNVPAARRVDLLGHALQ